MVSALLLLASCRSDKAKVIPRGELAEIYAEMLVTDQWILSTPNARMMADTSLVYAPILEKYGYDILDYMKSVDVYMDDPERFARILRTTVDILDDRITELEKKKEEMKREAELKKKTERFNPKIKFEEYFPYLLTEKYIHYHDSVTIELDSAKFIYRMRSVEKSDTLYEGVRMIVKSDAVAQKATVEKDSVAVEEKGLKKPVKRLVRPANLKNKRWQQEE